METSWVIVSTRHESINELILIVSHLMLVMGKVEGHNENWHGHVTALSVAPEYRRLNLAAKLMKGLEQTSEK